MICGADGIGLEPNPILSIGNEDYLLLLKDLLDAINVMEQYSAHPNLINKFHLIVFIEISRFKELCIWITK